MNRLFCVFAAFFLLMLSGCETPTRMSFLQPVMDSKQSPAADSGYVTGMFSRDWGPGRMEFALGIVNTATGKEYVMPFGVETLLPSSVSNQMTMIQLPPGEYKVAYWLDYSTRDRQQLAGADMPSGSMENTAFKLASGAVVFMGGYAARNSSGNTWSVHYQRVTPQSVQKALANSYPLFLKQPLSCLNCLQ